MKRTGGVNGPFEMGTGLTLGVGLEDGEVAV